MEYSLSDVPYKTPVSCITELKPQPPFSSLCLLTTQKKGSPEDAGLISNSLLQTLTALNLSQYLQSPSLKSSSTSQSAESFPLPMPSSLSKSHHTCVTDIQSTDFSNPAPGERVSTGSNCSKASSDLKRPAPQLLPFYHFLLLPAWQPISPVPSHSGPQAPYSPEPSRAPQR